MISSMRKTYTTAEYAHYLPAGGKRCPGSKEDQYADYPV